MSVINPTIPSEIFPKIVGNFSTPLSVINPTILSEIFSKIVGNFSTSLSVINPAILSEIFPKIFGQLKIQTSRKLFLMNWIFLRPNSTNYFQFYVGNISEYILGKIADPFGFLAVRLFSEIFPKNFLQCSKGILKFKNIHIWMFFIFFYKRSVKISNFQIAL